jgi:phospholipase/carboxylesterase
MIAIEKPPVVRWRKSTQPSSAGRPPLLVMLHGRGADEHDLFELAPAFDPAFAIASVRGPLPTDEGGYTWSESRGVGRPDPQSLRSTIDWLQRWLDSLAGGRPEPQRIYLMGFSAGMIMASALLFDQPTRYNGAILLSGALPFDTDLSITKSRLTDVDVFYAHGSFDTVIPADLVDRTASYLVERSGARLDAHTYPIGHEINATELADITSWLARH